MAVSVLTHYGGSVDFGATNGSVARFKQKFVLMQPSASPTTLTLPVRTKLGGSGLLYIVVNNGSQTVTVEDDLAVSQGTVLAGKVAFVFFTQSAEADTGTWQVIGSGNFTPGNIGEGDLRLNYGSVSEPIGTPLDLGTILTPLEGLSINLGFRVQTVGGIEWL